MREKKPKISVLMAVYNENIDELKKAINSILNQSFNDFELIVILDDPKNTKIKNLLDSYYKKDKRIRLLINKKNSGLAYSLNRALKIAKGEYIDRMDGDDISLKKRLEKQYNFMKKNKEIDLLFSYIIKIDEKGNKISEFLPDRKKIKDIKRWLFKEHLLVHPTLFCKSEVLKKNLYDKNFRRAQDFELWCRLIGKDYKFDIIEDKLLKYRLPSEGSVDSRIKKVKGFNYWTLKALIKHYSTYKFNLRFNERLTKESLIYISLLLPIKFIKTLIFLKDKIK